MQNELIFIDSLIQKHEAIRGHLRLICSLMDFSQEDSREEPGTISPARLDMAKARHVNLKQTIGYLDDGIRGHHAEEEEMLPALIGVPLVEAIRIEHGEMLKQLREINFALNNLDAQGFLENSQYIKMIIDNLCQLITNNTNEEDVILRLLKRRFI